MKTHRNCCGLDVHKQTIAACLIREDGSGNTCKEKRLFGTMTRDLRELAQWLRGAEVSAVAMEATGVYWVPGGMCLSGRACTYCSSTQNITKRFAAKRPI